MRSELDRLIMTALLMVSSSIGGIFIVQAIRNKLNTGRSRTVAAFIGFVLITLSICAIDMAWHMPVICKP